MKKSKMMSNSISNYNRQSLHILENFVTEHKPDVHDDFINCHCQMAAVTHEDYFKGNYSELI